MTWYWPCNCCVWVEATKCAGNTAPPELRVFVHQDDLPASISVFSYGGVQFEHNNCWTIDPSGPRVQLPHGAHRVSPATLYDTCTECEDDVDEPPSDGEGPDGGGPGGGGPGGPGGDGPGGGLPGEGETCGVKLEICPEHAGLWNGPDLYMRCADRPEQTRYVRIYGYCFEVPGSGGGPEVDPIPDGAQFVRIGGSFDDCHDCAYGKRARLCADQDDIPGIEDAPEIWVRSRNLPEETVGFLWGNFCYELRASAPEEIVPLDAFILNPVADFADCTECKLGIQAQRCPTEPDPGYEVWVEADEAAAFTSTVFFRYRELCYSLDPTTPGSTPTRIPFEAKKVVPKDEYLDCATCICGERSEPGDTGIKARLCPDQHIDLAEDVWVLEADIPPEATYFKRGDGSGSGGGGTCYYVDPADTPREIPVGSLIARIDNTFENCFDCTTGGGGFPPPVDPPPINPPPPWWPPLPPENFYELIDCLTGAGTNKWVRENHVCGVFGVVPCDIRGLVFVLADDRCYEVDNIAHEEPPGPTVTNQLVGLLPGVGGCNGYRLTDCENQKPDITTRDNLQAFVGRVVRLVDDATCWQVSEEPICLNDNPQAVQIDEDFVDCQECKDNPPPEEGGTSGDCIGCDQV